MLEAPTTMTPLATATTSAHDYNADNMLKHQLTTLTTATTATTSAH